MGEDAIRRPSLDDFAAAQVTAACRLREHDRAILGRERLPLYTAILGDARVVRAVRFGDLGAVRPATQECAEGMVRP